MRRRQAAAHASRPRTILASVYVLSMVCPASQAACKHSSATESENQRSALAVRLTAPHLDHSVVQSSLEAGRVAQIDAFDFWAGLLLLSKHIELLLSRLPSGGRHGAKDKCERRARRGAWSRKKTSRAIPIARLIAPSGQLNCGCIMLNTRSDQQGPLQDELAKLDPPLVRKQCWGGHGCCS